MLSLDPEKLLVVLLVALVVLGPDKLPRAARQAGAAWSQLRQWRARLEEEVRGSFPDLPSTDALTQAVRSPLSFLDRLADGHVAGGATATGATATAADALGGLRSPGHADGAGPGSEHGPDADPRTLAGDGLAEDARGAMPPPPADGLPGAPWSAGERDRVERPRSPEPRSPYDALRVGDPSMN